MIQDLAGRFRVVCEAVERACERSGRSRGEVQLIAVSKTVPVDAIRALLPFQQRHFGESRVQEALPKMDQLPEDLQWHFIGNMQKNKLRKIVARFPVIHSLASVEMASRLSQAAGELGVSPKVFIQINLADESSKGGFSPSDVRRSFGEFTLLPAIQLEGLMCIPPYCDDKESSRRYFEQLRGLRDELEASYGCKLPGLSMGMSHDFDVAIEEGATHVRVGSSIFGVRQNPALAGSDP